MRRARKVHSGRAHARQPHAAALSDLCRSGVRPAASGTSTATSMSTTSAATARCIAGSRRIRRRRRPPSNARCRSARTGAPRHELEVRLGRAASPAWSPCARDACASPAPAPRPRTWRCGWRAPSPAKAKVIRFVGHFHGWHDGVAAGAMSHFERRRARGHSGRPGRRRPSCCRPTIIARVADTLAEARRHCRRHARAVRRLVGAGAAAVGFSSPSCSKLTAASTACLLIFDEVITGFRWSRGGAQGRYAASRPICAFSPRSWPAGLPGGAVAGRADIMSQLDAAPRKAARREKIGSPGHLQRQSAVRGGRRRHRCRSSRSEEVVRQGRAHGRGQLRTGLRAILLDEQIAWGVYGEASAFLIFQNPRPVDDRSCQRFDPLALGLRGPQGRAQSRPRLPPAHRHARQRRRHHGRAGRLVSAVHGPSDVDRTLTAFRTAVRWLKAEGDV